MVDKSKKRSFQAAQRDFHEKLSLIEQFLPKVSRMGSAFPVPWDVHGSLPQKKPDQQQHSHERKPFNVMEPLIFIP